MARKRESSMNEEVTTMFDPEFQALIDVKTQQRPSLDEFEVSGGRPTVSKWFAQNPTAAEQCKAHMRKRGVRTTHAYLAQFFEFPFSDTALTDYALRMDWWD